MLAEQKQISRLFRKERDLRALPALARALLEEDSPLGFVDILPFDGNLGHPAFGPPDDLYWRKEIAELSETPRSSDPVKVAICPTCLGAGPPLRFCLDLIRARG